MEHFDAIIIGAGPAGIMAAIRAAERDKSVLLLERNNGLGKKLLISGKGRCNLTNSCDIEGALEKFSRTRDFLRNAFAKFFNTDLMDFFEDAGLRLKTERGGRVFPETDNAHDVLKILKSKLKNENIKILLGERLRDIITKDKKIEGAVTHSGKRFYSKHLALCTGGLTYPTTGSTGDGYKLAKKLGHDITRLKPALTPVVIKERFVRDWQGVSLRNVSLSLFNRNKKLNEKFGEMLFTHFGLSGPVVLDMSADIYDAIQSGQHVTLSLNFKPALDRTKLNNRLLREFKDAPNRILNNIFVNLLPKKLIKHFLEYCDVRYNKKANQVTAGERKRLINGLLDFRLTVKDLRPIRDGIITRGGISAKEINPKTMESRLVEGLFFAGEIIDIDAKTGGYNMQAAFSTGWVCGDNI